MNTELDTTTVYLLIILGLFFASIIVISLVIKLNRFSRELSRINMEIKRNTGSQLDYWKREKRLLWLSLLPFYHR